MKVPYTGFPIEPRHPAFTKETTAWLPILTVRVGPPQTHDLWSPRFGAVVDSGSPWCMFPTALADYFGIKVNTGVEGTVGGILKGDVEPIYFHNLKLQIASNWNITVKAGFTKKLAVPGILGRNGFFDNFKVHFDHSCKPPHLDIEKIELLQ